MRVVGGDQFIAGTPPKTLKRMSFFHPIPVIPIPRTFPRKRSSDRLRLGGRRAELILIKERPVRREDKARMTHRFTLTALLAALALAACAGPGTDNPPPILGKPTAPSPDTRAPAFVEAACGGCHAVEPPFLSPNPASPSFAAIANRRGLSEKSLADWLAEAHNYPEEMDFTLTRAQVDQIARYMVTLRHAGYVPEA
jgi:mono/diheme cytochrome c family protein